jgi:hypothetical protein
MGMLGEGVSSTWALDRHDLKALRQNESWLGWHCKDTGLAGNETEVQRNSNNY